MLVINIYTVYKLPTPPLRGVGMQQSVSKEEELIAKCQFWRASKWAFKNCAKAFFFVYIGFSKIARL